MTINGIFAAVGASYSANSKGAVYVYQEAKGGWQNMTETAKLTDGATQAEQFGQSVAMLPNTIVIGTRLAKKALIYVAGKQGWQSTSAPTATLSESRPGEGFGYAVAINPTLIVVGDPGYPFHFQHNHKGAGFVFHKPAQGWQSATATERIDGQGEGVGTSVAAAGNETVFMGAPYTLVNGNTYQGAVFYTLRVP